MYPLQAQSVTGTASSQSAAISRMPDEVWNTLITLVRIPELRRYFCPDEEEPPVRRSWPLYGNKA